MSIYLRKIVFTGLAVVIGLGLSSGAFAQGKGHGGGGKGHGKGGGGGQQQWNPGGGGGNRGGGGQGHVSRGGGSDRGGWQQAQRGGGGQPQINRGGGSGNGNGWGRMKQENRGGGGGFAQPRPQFRQQQVWQRQDWGRQQPKVHRQPQVASPIYQPNWKAERRIQKWEKHADDHRGRGFFNKRPVENFYRQQEHRQMVEDRKALRDQRKFDRDQSLGQRNNAWPFDYDRRDWRRGDDRDWSRLYSYQPYSYQQYYDPYVYPQYRSYVPYVAHYDYYQPSFYGYNGYYTEYYSGGSRTELIVRSIIGSIFGVAPIGASYVYDPYYDPYYANGGYYYYNGYYLDQPVYNFYDRVVCNPVTYYSDYDPGYYSTSYYPSYYSTPAYYTTTTTYYSPAYYDTYSYVPYGYSNYGYGNSLLSVIPGVGKLDRQTGGTISRALIAALGGAYSRGYDDGLFLDEYGYGSPFLGTTTYVSTTYLPAPLRSNEAQQIFNEGYELGYRDAVAQRDPYGQLDVVNCFLNQSIGI